MIVYSSYAQAGWRAYIKLRINETEALFSFEGDAGVEVNGFSEYVLDRTTSVGSITVTVNGTNLATNNIPTQSFPFADNYEFAQIEDETQGSIKIPKTTSPQTLTVVATVTLPKCISKRPTDGTTKTFTNSTATVTYTATIPAASDRTISYNAHGGTNAPASQTAIAITPITISSTIPTRAGYKFIGWTSSRYASDLADVMSPPYPSPQDYTQPGDTWTGTTNVTLYARWAYGYGVSLTSITSKRCDSNKSENDEGTYGVITGSYKLTGALANTGTLSAKYRKNGATSWTTVSNSLINPRTSTKAATDATKTVSFEIGPFGGEPTTSAALDTDSSYDIQVTVTDSGNNESALADYISTAFFTIDIQNGGKEIAFGTPANDTNLPSEGVFKCGMEARFIAGAKITSSELETQLTDLGWTDCIV